MILNSTCQICNKNFYTKPSQILRGRGKFCSRKCRGKFMIGSTPWNKGKGGYTLPSRPDNKLRCNEKSPVWKGDKVGYRALHYWVEGKLGKPSKCYFCVRPTKRFEWANISNEYKRDLNDWIRLCVKCHRAYDRSRRIFL